MARLPNVRVDNLRLLDLFCGAGGCAVGYHRAGFAEIVGVDNRPQPRYPFTFVLGDALEYVRKHGHEFDAIHASPPCQAWSIATYCNPGLRHTKSELISPTRAALNRLGKPWVIENVPRAPLRSPLVLCGSMFDLRVIRHRHFESNVPLRSPNSDCQHPPKGSVGRAGIRGKNPNDWLSVVGACDARIAKFAMKIDWMHSREELSQAIPPAYTEFIGGQLLDHFYNERRLALRVCPRGQRAR